MELEGKYYKIGTQRQEVKDTKTEDESFLILTYASIAKELRKRGKTDAEVFLAVGLPLTRFGSEKADFVKYLTDKKEVCFRFEGIEYHVRIVNAAVFPQCYAAVADRIVSFKKKTLIVDIGSWYLVIPSLGITVREGVACRQQEWRNYQYGKCRKHQKETIDEG